MRIPVRIVLLAVSALEAQAFLLSPQPLTSWASSKGKGVCNAGQLVGAKSDDMRMAAGAQGGDDLTISRTQATKILTWGMASLFVSTSVPLRPVAAEGGKGQIEEISQTLGSLKSSISEPSKWAEAIAVLSKAPYTKADLDKAFEAAAKSLPANIKKIYGGDGGQWIGLKNEAVDSMDALLAELVYLDGERKKGKSGLDTTDLLTYYDQVKDKTSAFLALYSNTELNSTLKGGGYCAYSSSAKCDEYDSSKDVEAAKKGGENYNTLRYGAGRLEKKQD